MSLKPGHATDGSRHEEPSPYGAAFSAIYGEKWDLWCRLVWPILQQYLPADRDGRSWLDLCCGSGGLLQLAEVDGFAVTGVDRSPFQLANAARKVPGARLIEADVRSFESANAYDVVTCVFDSLNYLTELDEVRALFERVASCLKPDGVFVFDIKTAEGFRTESAKTLETATGSVTFESAYDEAEALHRFTATGTVEEGGEHRPFHEVHIQRAHEAAVLEQALADLGLAVAVADFETGGEPAPRSKRLVFTARSGS